MEATNRDELPGRACEQTARQGEILRHRLEWIDARRAESWNRLDRLPEEWRTMSRPSRDVAERRSVLLVDSYHASRRGLADLLREHGHPVCEAHNGAEGLRIAREHSPALVVVDLWPFYSAALGMIERLRRGSAAERTSVLVLTSALSPSHRDRALAAGCDGFLEKPCPVEVVLAEVRRILESPARAGASYVTLLPIADGADGR